MVFSCSADLPGTPRVLHMAKTMVCAMDLKVFGKAHKRFGDGKSDQGIMKRTRQSLKSIEKVIPKHRIFKEGHPEGCSFDNLAKLVHDFEVTFHISGVTFARNSVIPGWLFRVRDAFSCSADPPATPRVLHMAKTMVCAVYLKVFGKARKRFAMGK